MKWEVLGNLLTIGFSRQEDLSSHTCPEGKLEAGNLGKILPSAHLFLSQEKSHAGQSLEVT